MLYLVFIRYVRKVFILKNSSLSVIAVFFATTVAIFTACDNGSDATIPEHVASLDEFLKLDCAPGDTFHVTIDGVKKDGYSVMADCLDGRVDTSEINMARGSLYDSVSNTLTDLRDGKVYKTGKAFGRTWMMENLNYKVPDPYWCGAEGSYCDSISICYENKSENCEKYGRLYKSIENSKNPKGYCPEDWELPSAEYWNDIVGYAFERWAITETYSAPKLKAYFHPAETWISNDSIPAGVDSIGLNFLAAGHHTGDFYDGQGLYFAIWLADTSFKRYVTGYPGGLSDFGNGTFRNSIRCIKTEIQQTPTYKPETSTLKDPRDSREYKTSIIGKQEWMAENLRRFGFSELQCLYGSVDSCAKYGALYTWSEAMNLPQHGYVTMQENKTQGICPEGWFIPAQSDWEKLIEFTRGQGIYPLGRMLRANESWTEPTTAKNNPDPLHFSVLAAGYSSRDSIFGDEGYETYFWITNMDKSLFWIDDDEPSRAKAVRFNFDYRYEVNKINIVEAYPNWRFSVRCMRDLE